MITQPVTEITINNLSDKPVYQVVRQLSDTRVIIDIGALVFADNVPVSSTEDGGWQFSDQLAKPDELAILNQLEIAQGTRDTTLVTKTKE